MVIIDIITNGEANTYDNNFSSFIYDKLNENSVPVIWGYNLPASDSEVFSRNIIITKNNNVDDDLFRNSDEGKSDKDYYVVSEEISPETSYVKYAFLTDYVDEDIWLNAALDVLSKVNIIDSDEPVRQETTTYTVISGDSLYSIAKRLNTTVDDLMQLNNLTSDALQPGQVLKVRRRPDMGSAFKEGDFEYIVEENDNIYDLSSRFNTTPDRIREKNDLLSNKLYPGQILIFDGTDSYNEVGGPLMYVVRLGDTLPSVAMKFDTSPEEIRRINNLPTDDLYMGQSLIIREAIEPTSFIYSVLPGDSLYSIAKKFNTSVDEIKKDNDLKNNFLKIGQKLKIDRPLMGGRRYTVMPGDSLYSIARKHNTTVRDLMDLNNLSDDKLMVGQSLIISR